MSTPIEELTAREQAESRKPKGEPTPVFTTLRAEPVAATVVSNHPVEVPAPAVPSTGVATSATPPSFLQHLEDEIKEKLGK